MFVQYPTPLYPLGNDAATIKRRARIDEAYEHTRTGQKSLLDVAFLRSVCVGLAISAANLGFQLFFKPLAGISIDEKEVKTVCVIDQASNCGLQSETEGSGVAFEVHQYTLVQRVAQLHGVCCCLFTAVKSQAMRCQVGTELSLADLVLYTTTEQLVPLQYNFNAFPAVAKWRAHITKSCPFMVDVHRDLHTNAAAALKKSGVYEPRSAL